MLTGINGVATMIEAGTDYNFVRDALFNDVLGLSDSAYNIYAGVTEGAAMVGSMILGFYHTTGQYKAAKAAQQYLGKGYTKLGKNRWVSKDGYRQVRWDQLIICTKENHLQFILTGMNTSTLLQEVLEMNLSKTFIYG